MNPRLRKSTLGAAAALALAGRLVAADLSPATANVVESARPMQMPPFIVDDTTSKFATWKWGYTSFRGYEVLTYCDDAVTMRFITGLSRQISILADIAPAAFENEPSVPTALILMDRTQEQTISDGMRKVMTERTGSLNTKTSGLSVHRVFFPQLLLHDSESTAINVVLDDWDNYDTVVLEPGYVRYLLETRRPHLPAWYVDAMTNLYAHALFLPTKVVFSPMEWHSDDAEAKALRKNPSLPRALIPMNAVLLTHPASEGFDDDSRERVHRWKAQSELFLHWVLADKSKGRIRALKKYFDLGTAGRRESSFRECFGLGYTEIGIQLDQYLPKALNETLTVYRDDDVPIGTPRDATEAEYARIWGNWGLMEIQFVQDQDPLMVHPYIAQAEHTLGGAYKKGEREPRFMAVLGMHDVGMKRPDEARAVMESAAAEKANYPAMYVELARLRFREAMAKPGAAGGKLDGKQVASVMEPLQAARRLSPPQGGTYLLYALALGNGEIEPRPEDFRVLEEGVRYFPEDAELTTAVAVLKDRREAANVSEPSGAR
jgi:hypothetical protein